MTVASYDDLAGWPEPRPLPGLPAVEPFDPELLPVQMRAWIMDVAERMQVPPDFVAVPALIAAGAVVGRRIAIRPQAHTDWSVVPNLWGMIVGRPGVMKSPAMAQALAPIRRLDALASEENDRALAAHVAEVEAFKIARASAIKAAKKGHQAELGTLPPDEPALKRYVVNDTSYERLGEIMADNSNGLLAYRDELVSLLKPLDREENASARGFYLTAWNGTEGYTFDRIGRGHTFIRACCLSLLGAVQPGKLAAYLNDAVRGGAGDDGFAQRFGLLVWPDVSPDWRDVDYEPDGDARRHAHLIFDHLDHLSPDAIGAEVDTFDPIPFLRFTPEALERFKDWRAEMEPRLRNDELPPAMAAHLSKYRGLVPKLVLLFHLIDRGTGPIPLPALIRALAWARYLESHAARAYASVTQSRTTAAKALLARIKAGDLHREFTARDVQRRGWSGLTERVDVGEALDVLTLHDWIAAEEIEIGSKGGRPTTVYEINPRGVRGLRKATA